MYLPFLQGTFLYMVGLISWEQSFKGLVQQFHYFQGCGSGFGLDPDSETLWIRIRIRIHIGNPDPDSGARKLRNFSGKMHFLVIF
jgi:hypothetical protein